MPHHLHFFAVDGDVSKVEQLARIEFNAAIVYSQLSGGKLRNATQLRLCSEEVSWRQFCILREEDLSKLKFSAGPDGEEAFVCDFTSPVISLSLGSITCRDLTECSMYYSDRTLDGEGREILHDSEYSLWAAKFLRGVKTLFPERRGMFYVGESATHWSLNTGGRFVRQILQPNGTYRTTEY